MTIRLHLDSYLQKHGITPYRLIKESGLAQGTVYGMVNNPLQRVDLISLGKVIKALERITGNEVAVTDLIFESEVQPGQEGKPAKSGEGKS